MLKLKLVSVGKTREKWLEAGMEDYARRLKPWISLEYLWVKEDVLLPGAVVGDSAVVCLDPQGKMLDSEGFTTFLYDQWDRNGARLTMVIGGAVGLPASMRQRYPLLSLSPMTFPHQLTRLILLEQVYRATEIRRGSPYHK